VDNVEKAAFALNVVNILSITTPVTRLTGFTYAKMVTVGSNCYVSVMLPLRKRLTRSESHVTSLPSACQQMLAAMALNLSKVSELFADEISVSTTGEKHLN
jgi:hypothetical protein